MITVVQTYHDDEHIDKIAFFGIVINSTHVNFELSIRTLL